MLILPADQREALPARRLEASLAWDRFIRFCKELGHGEIAVLKIQDGVPMMAESVTKKIKFS
jgi:hypothetical protein